MLLGLTGDEHGLGSRPGVHLALRTPAPRAEATADELGIRIALTCCEAESFGRNHRRPRPCSVVDRLSAISTDDATIIIGTFAVAVSASQANTRCPIAVSLRRPPVGVEAILAVLERRFRVLRFEDAATR